MFLIEEEIDSKGKEQEKERALKLAKFYKEEGLYEDAIKNYELYIFLTGDGEVDAQIFKDLAVCYSLTGLTAEAINNLKKAARNNNGDISVVYLLAQMYEQSGMFDEAEYYYNEILKKDENMSSVYYQLGEIAYKKGNVDVAIVNWNKVTELEPTNSYAHYLLGSLYYYKKNYEKAEEEFKSALTNGFKSSQLYNYLGKIYAKSNEREKARLNFLIAIDRDRANNVIYENYLNVLDETEMQDEEAKLNRYLDDDIINKYRLGILHKVAREYQKAKEVLEDILANAKIDSNLKVKITSILNDINEKN